MKTNLNWKSKCLKNTCNIYLQGNLVGTLNENKWKNVAHGELNGKRFVFSTNGFFNPITQITDLTTNELIGTITYNNWRTRAEIKYGDKSIKWRYNNAWNTRWSMFDHNAVKLSFKGSITKGNVECDEMNELLILTGLFVTNYFWQTTLLAVFAALIPIWVAALH